MKYQDPDFHDGSGYHVNDIEPIPEAKWRTVAEDLANPDQYRHAWQPSKQKYTSPALVETLTRWDQYNQVIIKSWDLAGQWGVGGSILRFDNNKTHKRTDDFRFTIQTRKFDRLKPNMDRLREEVDCAVASLDSYLVGGIERLTGVTVSGDVQLIVTRIGSEYKYGWISLADYMFIPVTNKWIMNERSSNPSLDLQQVIKQTLSIEQAIEFQRELENK